MLTDLPIWRSLKTHYEKIRNIKLYDLFSIIDRKSYNRTERFTLEGAGIIIDFSKNLITEETLKLLIKLAYSTNVLSQRDMMFFGKSINNVEKHLVLHTALRDSNRKSPYYKQINEIKIKMEYFSKKIRNGLWLGYTGKRIRYILNIGIGGSDLGPRMIIHALQDFVSPNFSIYFISNIDGSTLYKVLNKINHEETLVIIVSKTFETLETISNAKIIRDWFLKNGCSQGNLILHFIAVSANFDKAIKFGIFKDNIFKICKSTSGRYSIWSAVGLSVMIAIGSDKFNELLLGANDMDIHFFTTPLERNLPVIHGLISIWYRNFFELPTYLIAPYSDALYYLPSYIQQLEMESNGKLTRLDGIIANYQTSAIIWGGTCTNAQHSFFQMIHQGSTIVPIDFIAVLSPNHPYINHHYKLLANCFAQSKALMMGNNTKQIKKLINKNKFRLIPHMSLSGNRPSTTILLKKITPRSIGALIALYEHKVIVESFIWNINPFDQWGVELGKTFSKVIENDLENDQDTKNHDSSTKMLIKLAKKFLKN